MSEEIRRIAGARMIRAEDLDLTAFQVTPAMVAGFRGEANGGFWVRQRMAPWLSESGRAASGGRVKP